MSIEKSIEKGTQEDENMKKLKVIEHLLVSHSPARMTWKTQGIACSPTSFWPAQVSVP
jgi:hypothetical protein